MIDLIKSLFSNPLVPCDAITIPQISLYPWKEGYGHPHPQKHLPVHPIAHHVVTAAPVHHVTPSPLHHVTPSPVHNVYKPEPVYHQQPYQPTPAPYSPAPSAPLQYGATGHTKITPFVHSPLHRFNAAVGK